PNPSRRTELVALAAIVIAALALRFYDLAELPYGLWRDEGRHGLEALHMLADPNYRPAYILGGVDLPGLGLMPFAWALRIWGIHVWSMRTVTALAGALAVLPLYALTRRLFGRGAIPLLAAGLLAVSSWSITLSRFSFPTIFDPLLQLTALWLMMVGLDLEPRTEGQEPRTENQEPRTGYPLGQPRTENREPTTGYPLGQPRTETREQGTLWVNQEPRTEESGVYRRQSVARLGRYVALLLAGICLGLAAQTYHTGRLGILTSGLLALLLLWRALSRWRAWLAGVLVLIVGFVLAASPLLGYAWQNPSAFNGRVGLVYLLSNQSPDKRPPFLRLDESIGRHLLMFNVRGDSNGRQGSPNQPMLDFVAGLGLLAGIATLLQRQRDWRSMFVLGALAIGLLPSLLSVESPHAMRAIDALPFACIAAAVGLAQLWRIVAQAKNREPRTENRTRMTGFLLVVRRSSFVILVLCVALALNAYTYFVNMPNDREVWTSVYPLHTRIGEYVRELTDTQGAQAASQVFVAERLTDNPVFGYLTYGLPVQTFGDQRLSS
ncbi:MAG TPA: glycosyltransferase family 39 protein, partial [Roseiflexaceae bacterium]|nr:glycosyltransferase family 39 protein [Roseiflexaceae bacterium]